MRRAAALLVLVFGLGTGVSAAAPKVDWKRLRHVYYDLSRVEAFISTGPGWGGRVVKPLGGYQRGLTPDWAIERGLLPQPLWTAACGRKPQTVLFSDSFELPGPAKEGTLIVAYAGLGSLQAIDSATVSANGRELGRTKSLVSGYAKIALDAADLRAFRYGSNSISVRATKPALPAGVTACNTANDNLTSKRRVGVAVGLHLTFAADMQTSQSFRGPKQFFKATPNRTVVIEGLLKVRNAGPAASVSGRFGVELLGAASLRSLTGVGATEVKAPAPIGGCETEIRNPFMYIVVTCPYTDFPPGKSLVVKVPVVIRVVEDLAVNFSQATVKVSWGIGGIGDDGTVNGQAHEIVFCGPQASDPGCQQAK